MNDNKDDKLKDLKSDIEKFDKDTERWIWKKSEQKYGIKYEDRWTYYKRLTVVGIVVFVLALGNIFVSIQLFPYLSEIPLGIPAYNIGSWALILVVMMLLWKKYVKK